MDGRMYCMPQSNAVREWVRRARADEHMDLRELDAIADRIDREMVELPCDRDGVPIHVGDTVRRYMSDMKTTVTVLRMGDSGWSVFTDHDPYCIEASYVSHIFPDSWERIADELESWCDDADVDGDACEKPRDLADRIRKLAEMEDSDA